ncbi:MAG: HAD-IA family hydrolase [Myxococcota bacterium]
MKTFLFDLDGTLLDSIELILTSFHHTSRTHLDRAFPDDYWLAGVGTPLREQLSAIASNEAELDEMLQTYIAFNLAQHDALAKPFPGVTNAVIALHARGVPMALVTSKLRRGATRGLSLLGLESELSVMVCADDVTHGKPHPEPVLKALEALNVEPSEAIFIGDSVHDIEAGRAAGVATGAVGWGPFPRETLDVASPDRWFHSPEEWLDL